MQSNHNLAIESEITRLTASLPGASRAVARQLQLRMKELREQLEAVQRQERATDE